MLWKEVVFMDEDKEREENRQVTAKLNSRLTANEEELVEKKLREYFGSDERIKKVYGETVRGTNIDMVDFTRSFMRGALFPVEPYKEEEKKNVWF